MGMRVIMGLIVGGLGVYFLTPHVDCLLLAGFIGIFFTCIGAIIGYTLEN